MLLGAASFALAFAQRPGLATADTKINLHVDPGRFLADIASMWTSTGQLGDVQSGQQAGYLFPMGPFFAVGHGIGLADWVVQRLWLGALLALAAWGVVRLLDAMLDRPRGIAHLTAGAVTLLNPFVVTYVNRTTVTLLAYTALPWLLLAVYRGLREERGWRWPAAFALLVTASGGGVNGAVTAWMLLGPALLLLYELWFGGISRRTCWTFVLRTVPLTVALSLWWIVPAYVQSSYGVGFLHFTEQPGSIWGTTSATESLRLMSFWLSYVGIGFGGKAIPYFDDSRTLLFSVPVVVASLLAPAAALTGFVWTRRWRYGPFFLGLALIAVLVMMAGFPDGTLLRHGLTFAYYHFSAVQFLRASYKAAPLLAIALACLAGAGAASVGPRLGGPVLRGLACAVGLVVLALSAWPLVTGRAQDAQVSYKRIPVAWREAASKLDRTLPANSRAIVLPGDLFSFYTWGGTVDPVLPALSDRPVAERSEVPYSDFRATDLLWTIDGLVHQQRLLPGQLRPLLSLIGVRQVVTGTDDDLARSDAPAPADAAAALASQPGFARASKSYGPVRSFAPTTVGPSVSLPEARTYDLPSARGLVGVEPRSAPVIVDGSAPALAGLAAFGQLSPARALMYAADLTPAALRSSLAGGGTLVISDSNRRQAFVPGSLEENVGPVLTPDQSVTADGTMLDPFGLGPDYETVAAYSGVRSVEAPYSPERPQSLAHDAIAALDGSVDTAWLADPTLEPSQRWLQIDFSKPRDIGSVELMPDGSVRQVAIAGRTFAIHPGWNRLGLGLRSAPGLRVTLTDVASGAGGIRELRIPGVSATEALRLPVDAARDVAGDPLTHVALRYLFERESGEAAIRRVFQLPVARRFTANAWVTVGSGTADNRLDRLDGYRGPIVATSSSRVDGKPEWRASSALDGDPGTAWIGDYGAGQPAWIQWSSPRAMSVRTLSLGAPALPVRRPTAIRVLWPGGSTPPLSVSTSGLVALERTVRARRLRIEVLRAVAPTGATPADRRAVGISSIGGVAGLGRIAPPRSAVFATPCGSPLVAVDGALIGLRVTGSETAFESGAPMRAVSCGPVSLAAGTQQLAVPSGPFAVDELQLSSPAPSPVAGASAGGGRVVDSGTAGRGSYDHVRVAVAGSSWLVLREGYNRGWQASCGSRSLGAPVPIDGYANGWRVGPGCTQVRFAFGPDRLAEIGYIVSGVAGLLCLVLLLVGVVRRRSAPVAGLPAELVPAADARWSLGRVAAVAVVAGLVFAFVFGPWAGVVTIPVLGFVLWRGIGARALTLVAGVLLGIVVPIVYVVHPGDSSGGNHAAYASQHMLANWLGVAAIGLLVVALWRSLSGVRRPARAARGRAARRRSRSA
jgi:hypothetical protein